MKKKIYLAFLWHQHQPMYKNPTTGTYELPWVRLHATKDYYDMVAILDDFPKIKSNFNLVPSLLIQLEEYASGKAKDKFLELTLKNAADLTQDDKVFVLFNFFMANWENMICKNNRYLQLLEQRGRHTSQSEIRNSLAFFKEQDFRDLQVWFNLAWFDPYWIKTDEFIKSLYAKGRDFTEEEKHKLIQKQLEICGKIVQKHKEAQDRGQIEVSVSPFYHPILPLLCDTDCAKQSAPHMQLPKERFSHPEDADWHIKAAVKHYETLFGQKPKGMWPSEGSVSDMAAELISQSGISWIATDETVLFNSKKDIGGDRRKLFMPYKIGNSQDKGLNIIFRDHGLSDSIGFIYSKWNAQDAANDFISKLYDIRNYMDSFCEAPLISVILDGENCWEYYQNDGWDFLSALYQKLSDNPDIETVRISDYLEKFPAQEKIETLTAGSWISGDFHIWIGDSEDNTSWDALSAARDFLFSFLEANPQFKNSPEEKQAFDALRAAEGSDWNWWYGPDNTSENDAVFDYIYRLLLIKIYHIFGQKSPDNLYSAIKNTLRNKAGSFNPPKAHINPVIDGKISDDWKDGGSYEVGHTGGSMHQVASIIKTIRYGRNTENIFIALELNNDIFAKTIMDLEFKIVFINPINSEIVFAFDSHKKVSKFFIENQGQQTNLNYDNVCYEQSIEAAVSLNTLNLPQYDNLEFRIVVYKNGFEIEKSPYPETIKLKNE